MNIWEPLLGECLKCVKEPTNEIDKNAVAVVRTNSISKDVVVGHYILFVLFDQCVGLSAIGRSVIGENIDWDLKMVSAI